MQTIMVATDFSERSDRALRRTTLLAKQFEADVTLVHVVDDDRPVYRVDSERRQAEAMLQRLASTMHKMDGVACDVRVKVGAPFSEIVQAVEEVTPDLLVLGPHRRQLLKDAFVGTAAERAIRLVSCPVLVVNAPPVANYRHVMQTTDLSDLSRVAIQRFSALGIGQSTRNCVLYVYDVLALRLVRFESVSRDEQNYYQEEARKEAAREVSEFLKSTGTTGAKMILRPLESTILCEILKSASEEETDLIVISTCGRGGLAKVVLGSVAEQVLAESSVDVLAIPPLGD